MAAPKNDAKCPDCGKSLSGPGGSIMVESVRAGYRGATESGRSDRQVDVVFCPSCGRLFTVLEHPKL
jgi:ribosomal protein S27E